MTVADEGDWLCPWESISVLGAGLYLHSAPYSKEHALSLNCRRATQVALVHRPRIGLVFSCEIIFSRLLGRGRRTSADP